MRFPAHSFAGALPDTAVDSLTESVGITGVLAVRLDHVAWKTTARGIKDTRCRRTGSA
jgi:hypothetical protein